MRALFVLLLAIPLAVAARPVAALTVQYEGTLDLRGHYPRPGDTRPYRSLQIFVADSTGSARLDWTTWVEGDTTRTPETWLYRDGRLLKRDAPSAAWRELSGERAAIERLQVLAGLPWLVPAHTSAVCSRRRGRIDSAVHRRPHPRLGDIADRIEYRWDGTTVPVPASLHLRLYERDHDFTLRAERTAYTPDAAADSLLALPPAWDPPGLDDHSGVAPRIVEQAPGIHAVEFDDLDSRSLVVEFEDYVAMIEFAVSSANGERLVDLVRARWPHKPIRWALFSHHHPHYTGGLRALIAAGATIVTTPGNAEFVRQVARYPFRRWPDRLQRTPKPLRLQTFTGRFELADSTQQLIAIDIGKRSTHTDEFVVFWLPRARLVFEAEQGWLGRGDALRAGRRAGGFLAVLEAEGVVCDRLVQSWPMRDTEPSVTRSELERLVQERARAR